MTTTKSERTEKILAALRAAQWQEERTSPETPAARPGVAAEVAKPQPTVLALDADERVIVTDLLRASAGELFHELHHTDVRAMRRRLQARLAVIERLLGQLSPRGDAT